MSQYECYCGRCMGADPPCSVTGDHEYGSGATCKDCGHFNGRLLAWLRMEKAQKEGRHHGDHFHRTTANAEKCPRPTHDEAVCGDKGGCLVHEPSAAWCTAQDAAIYGTVEAGSEGVEPRARLGKSGSASTAP